MNRSQRRLRFRGDAALFARMAGMLAEALTDFQQFAATTGFRKRPMAHAKTKPGDRRQRRPRFGWLIGPLHLAQNLALVISASVLLAYYWALMPAWALPLFCQVFFGLASAFMGAGIASATARDAYLGPGLAACRPLVALLVGASIGIITGLYFGDSWLTLASASGGAIGGFADALFNSETLED